MLAIGWLWTATMIWLFGLPSLLPERGSLGIAPEASAVSAGAAVALVAVPWVRRLDLRWTLLMALPLFGAVRALAGEALGAFSLQEAVEFVYVVGAVGLGAGVGRRMVAFEAALETLSGGDARQRAASFDQAQEELYREIRRARRYKRPASLMTVASSVVDTPPKAQLTPEVLREIADKYSKAQVEGLLLHETDAAALVAQRGDHFVVLLPETDPATARAAARRLAAAAAERWGLELRFGIAGFPEEEVTLDGLIQRAETELRSERQGPAMRWVRQRRGRTMHLAAAPDDGGGTPRSGTRG